MGQKKGLCLAVFFMVYGLLVTTFSASANLPDYCNGYESMVNSCGNDLTGSGPSFSPSRDCCIGSFNGFNHAMLDHGKGIVNFCKCMQFAVKNLKFDPHKIIQVPDECGFKINFSVDKCVSGKLLAPSHQNIPETVHV